MFVDRTCLSNFTLEDVKMRWVFSLCLIGLLGCTQSPDISIIDCENSCRRQGQKLKNYEIGTAITIIKPRPTVSCECQPDSPEKR